MLEIDLHTHTQKSGQAVQILNIFAQDLPFSDEHRIYSAGIHPWHIDRVDPENCWGLLETASNQENMVAVGECGLDKSIKTDFALQKQYFRKHAETAEKHSKPLIIHCVRAFNDLINVKNEVRPTVPWIIHGFRGNRQTTEQLISHNFRFSIGKSLLTDHIKKEVLALIPVDWLFFETDDDDISIAEVYQLASQILMIDEEALQQIVFQNFERIFGTQNALHNYLT